MGSFATTRCRNSELWFANNPQLEQVILGYVAKYKLRYDMKLYAFAIEGNHIQFPARFPNCNRSSFMRDLNSSVARAVDRLVEEYPGGTLFQRRYSSEFMPADEDIENWFFYTVLQPVQDCLVERISDYPFYNCFHDAIYGITREYEVVNWQRYNAAKKRNPSARIRDFVEIVELKYDRVPGYEHLSQREYAKMMLEKLEKRRAQIVKENLEKGKRYLGRENLLQVIPGSRPMKTKTSTRTSHRPRVLCICPVRRKDTYKWYFDRYYSYKEASKRYRAGELDVVFPPGTYKPHIPPPRIP